MKTLILGKGYVGSALKKHFDNACYTDWKIDEDYDQYSKEKLREFGTIVLVAGHSSVTQCLADPVGAWENNVSKFKRLLDKIHDQTFIYASSGSLYNNCKDTTENNSEFNLTNIYDLTKFTIDQLARLSNKNYYGLRFGTVCGYSPIMRNDLMINKMVANSHTGIVSVANPDIKRPILAMSDLVRAVESIINNPVNPGLYNLASFTKTIGEMGAGVARLKGCIVEKLPNTPAYNFDMDTTKFEKTYDFSFEGTVKSIVESLNENTK